jgi:hypothetical protein
VSRLVYPGYPQDPLVEGNGLGLAPSWHGQLHVVDAEDRHTLMLSRPRRQTKSWTSAVAA